MKRDIYVTYYTKEGKLEFTQEEWNRFKSNPQKPLVFHREDGPAIEWSDGSRGWYFDGLLHREDGPAMEWANGDKAWWIDGMLHREDGPAKEYNDGLKEWWRHGSMLSILPKELLLKYMKVNKFTLAHLLTDPDSVVRNSASLYSWEKENA